MDQNIALEALSALTGCTVKPRPAGGFPDNGYSGGGIPEVISQFNSLTTSNDQPAVQDFGLNGFISPQELTIENVISTVFFYDTFQSLRSNGGPVLGSSGGPVLGSTGGSVLGSSGGAVLGSSGGAVLGSSGGAVLGSSGGPVLGSIGDKVKCFYPQDSPPLQKDMEKEKQKEKEKEMSINVEKFFSPGYDYDFRGSENPSKCLRGEEPYTRPWGWYRFALKVKDKYPEGSTWLGSPGWRNQSSPGEWPVSFHGTTLEGAIGITEGHYEPGSGAVHGYGIYSTPDIKIAERDRYAKKFTSKTDGKTYKVVMQNRINPEKRERTKVKDFWLIEIKRKYTSEQVKKIVTESIRPYGILIKEV